MNEPDRQPRKGDPRATMKNGDSILGMFWRWISGLGLATTLLVLLGVLTWLATLEMVDIGLLEVLRKYFNWRAWYVLAKMPLPFTELKLVLPLPGGYWVCALLLLNLTLGGLLRIEWSLKSVGVMLSHFGILFMVAAGGVAQLYEKRGVMLLFEGQQADYAVSLFEPSIEVAEIVDGKAAGEVAVATSKELAGLAEADVRRIVFPNKPFDLEVTGWLPNAVVRPVGPDNGHRSVDGWSLTGVPKEKEGELNAPACFARVVDRDGAKGEPFILAVPNWRTGLDAYAPQVIEADGRKFAVRLVKATIPVPFRVELDDAMAEFYPNSGKPAEYKSDIRRIGADGEPVPVRIEMNQPMRQGGFTLYQHTMNAGGMQRGGRERSGFEVVSNPADQWPKYGLFIVTAGLLVHFVAKFAKFLTRATQPETPKAS